MSIDQMFNLQGKVALVTGACQWIGWDIASVFAEAGASVIITSRDLSKARKASERLAAEYGSSALGIDLEVGDPQSVKRCFDRVKEWKGHLDILVNNAGGGSGHSEGNILYRDPADQEVLVRANLLGVLYCCQAAARIMVPKRSGVIINIASIAGLIGRDRRMYEQNSMKGQPVDYAAAKAGRTVELVKTIPGVGVITAATVREYVDDINRFRGYKQLSSYAGLAPWVQNSNQRERQGRITKRGPEELRAALVQIVLGMVRNRRRTGAYRIMERYVLKNNEPFDPVRMTDPVLKEAAREMRWAVMLTA